MSTNNEDRRPKSMAEALRRFHAIQPHFHSVVRNPLPAEAVKETRLLAGWMDVQGELLRLGRLMEEAYVRLSDDERDTPLADLLLVIQNHLGTIAEAALAVEELEWAIHQHELAATKAKPDPGISAQMNQSEPAIAGQEVA